MTKVRVNPRALIGPAQDEQAHRAAFHAMTPEQRDRIAQAFAPIVAGVQAFQKNLERSGLSETLAGFQRIGEDLARAQEMEARLLAAAPRDRRPEVRRLLATLQDAPVDAAIAALSEALRFVEDPFYRLAPSGRSWAIVWNAWRVIQGWASAPTLSNVAEDAAPVTAEPALARGRPCTGRPERRPVSRIARRIAPNAPPWRHALRTSAAAPAVIVTKHRGPP